MRALSTFSGNSLARTLSFLVLLAIIGVIGVLFFQVMSTFLVPLFFAAVLVVLAWPVHARILAWTKGRAAIAAALSTTLMILAVVLPFAFVVTMASVEVVGLLRQTQARTFQSRILELRSWAGMDVPLTEPVRRIETHLLALEQINHDEHLVPGPAGDALRRQASKDYHVGQLESDLKTLAADPNAPDGATLDSIAGLIGPLRNVNPPSAEFDTVLAELRSRYDRLSESVFGTGTLAQVRKLANPTEDEIRDWTRRGLLAVRDWIVAQWGDASGRVGQFLLSTVVLLVAIYFFFLDGPAMIRGGMRLSPLDDRYEQELLEEFDRASRSVVLALVLAAVAQGLLAGVAYAVLGVPSVFLLTVLTTLVAIIPFLGAGGVYIPVSIGLWLWADRPYAAILLFLWGVGVVSTVDNLIRPWILHGQSRLNPLLALLSVIGGVKALGPIGLLLGPMIVIYLSTLLRILQREVISLDAETVASKLQSRRSARPIRPYGPAPRHTRRASRRPAGMTPRPPEPV